MTTEAPASVGSVADVGSLSDQIPRFMRLIHAFKGSAGADGRDRAPLVLLHSLVRLGPLRQGALAELIHADPSTVSRHVAALVEQGLVDRIADASDGRASRLLVTEAGHAALDGLRREREALLRRATASWSEDEVTTLTRLFARLVDDLAATLPTTLPVITASREKR